MLAPFEIIGSFTIEVSVGRISFKGKLISRGVPCIFRTLCWSMLWITCGHFFDFSDLKTIYYLTKNSLIYFVKKGEYILLPTALSQESWSLSWPRGVLVSEVCGCQQAVRDQGHLPPGDTLGAEPCSHSSTAIWDEAAASPLVLVRSPGARHPVSG